MISLSPLLSKNVNEGLVGSGPRGYGGYRGIWWLPSVKPRNMQVNRISFAQNGLVCIPNQMGMFTDDYEMKICTGGSTEVANDQLSIMEIRRSVRMVP